MTSQSPIRIAELLASRLCHDLITPIGAINTGLELFQDTSPDHLTESQEILNLILHSAQTAAARVSFFRAAFGSTGGRISFEEARSLAENYFQRSKIKLEWSPPSQKELPLKGLTRLLLNSILWVGECAPRGGTLSISVSSDDNFCLALLLKADSIILHQGTVEALEGQVSLEELTPRTAPCYLIFCLVQENEGILTFKKSQSPSELFLEIKGKAPLS